MAPDVADRAPFGASVDPVGEAQHRIDDEADHQEEREQDGEAGVAEPASMALVRGAVVGRGAGEAGALLFAQKGCGGCHTVEGVSDPPPGELVLVLRRKPGVRDLFGSGEAYQASVRVSS